jgi:hypothetical protein
VGLPHFRERRCCARRIPRGMGDCRFVHTNLQQIQRLLSFRPSPIAAFCGSGGGGGSRGGNGGGAEGGGGGGLEPGPSPRAASSEKRGLEPGIPRPVSVATGSYASVPFVTGMGGPEARPVGRSAYACRASCLLLSSNLDQVCVAAERLIAGH